MRRALKCPRCGGLTFADFVREWIYIRCGHCPMILDREQHAVSDDEEEVKGHK